MSFTYSFNWEITSSPLLYETLRPPLYHLFWPCWNRSPDYLPICILISHAGHSLASLPSPVDHKTPQRFLTPLAWYRGSIWCLTTLNILKG